ncbi:TolC family outer membrane protein [Ramlibacter sp. PS3R-8]|uniref:TolC family outer membrane protein n=1 Tax=Ramlibacter sp. PS3R-8 TaxID=3133437 RepID=UPI003095DD00
MNQNTNEKDARRRRNGARRAIALLLCGPVLLAHAQVAQPPLTLRDAAQQAVLTNPEVLARWHGVRAAEGERDAARGGFFPRVDLSLSAGNERQNDVTGGNYGRGSGSLTLTQLLYDGFATRDEVRRLDHTTRVRLFELISTSESVALEAARAFLDVVRYRDLVQLAEENFIEHRTVYAQTDQRVKAKVARAVDFEQVTGRLALAEANLLIETSNLHDTTARFQRIVGRTPPAQLAVPPHLTQGLPNDATTALVQTSERNAAVLAAIESVRAANAALDVRKDAYAPRIDFRLRRDQGRNVDGLPGGTNANVAEVVLNWNLFNGFADRARERQFAEQANVARDQRDKTCRDLRQTTLIAYNDGVKLREQLEYLLLHESSLDKTLVAYRQQFQIGQRSLLDLLDTENERYQARRSVVNARIDLALAYIRLHAGIGTLLQALDLSRPATRDDQDLRTWAIDGDGAQQCPPEPVAVYTVDKDALVQRAMQQVLRTPAPTLSAALERPDASAAAPVVVAPAAPAAAPVVVAPAAPAAAPSMDAVLSALETWRAAWARRDVDAYLRSYGPAFVAPQGMERKAWEQRRRAIIGKSSGVSVDLGQPEVAFVAEDRATTRFTQTYRSASYEDRVRKTLEWQRLDGRWVIVSETSEPLAAR